MSNSKQDFGEDPVRVRETDHYQDEYIQSFVDRWDRLIDWERRAQTEGQFFIEHLKQRGARRVLDVAAGTGFHSVRLLEAGFDVVSADGNAQMLYRAFENGRRRGHVLRTVQADWRWLKRDIHESFDAVVCLGNAFTHLFADNDRRKALAEFYSVLAHDGVLVLDQRNYDAILDRGYSSKHTYYYCGQDVSVQPVHVDEGLARFAYDFGSGERYYLNMFPLRRAYVQTLLQQVGFQNIETYGDFQETFKDEEPDFYIHVASKAYRRSVVVNSLADTPSAEDSARQYYDSRDADEFYAQIWGGEDIHIGMYERPDEDIAIASERTVEFMLSKLGKGALDEKSVVLDIGSGYSGAARRIARRHGCRVVSLNLSKVENDRARVLNEQQGLSSLIDVIEGSYESIPYPEDHFDLVWSQDAVLHSGNRPRVLAEVARVLKKSGRLIFTDPMMSDDCPPGVLQPILDRIHLESLATPSFYRATLSSLGLEELVFERLTGHLTTHYQRVLEETTARAEDLVHAGVSRDYIERMKVGLQHWVDGGHRSHLCWGIFLFAKRKV